MNNNSSKESHGKKVFVGLSGGVDSALTINLLKERGFDVTGVFIKVWQPDFLECNWRDERRDAMRVAAKLNVPFLFFDFEEEYKKQVADYMIEEYKRGRTPNPDVLCNRVIKFGSFWEKAKEFGADYIATGHYARISNELGKYKLLEGKDKDKDQSYFLWMLKEDELSHILFPVGEYTKKEVRKMALDRNIPVADKKDSQGVCFMGDISLEEFLSHFIDVKQGMVLNERGEEIGTHTGSIFYTIGERRGFEITKKTPEDKPYYVIAKDIDKNTITVSSNQEIIEEASPSEISISNVNWINEPTQPNVLGRIRYRQQKIPITIDTDDNRLIINFKNKQRGLSYGQSIVFYDGEECLGGGIMKDNIS
jgi:tRNA-uridine 2-sulfurtransferase